ncbi:phage distal tail protein [Williamsia sterculiae]|uniref:Phage tail protein n=1 Tax=Williamsia sterculiae TaxID=1344003 RepID=A0A1N7GF90_9NOCA|nr:phage tail domain-containing protein [Williamsia sterculiae]SIS11295.1 Phage tail protein [Williamsia sterculiae]
MIVTLNGLTLNDPNSGLGIYLDEPIDGLGLAPIRTSTGTYSGRDGGYVGAQFYGMRLITFTGSLFSSAGAAGVEANRRALIAAASASAIALTIVTKAGNSYLINCYIDSLDIPVRKSINYAPFKLTLIAPDPTIYDNSTGGANTATVNLSIGGGVTWPIAWTPVVWAPGAQPTTINNTGTVPTYPVITLTNQMSSPMIMNKTTGQFFTLSGLTTAAGDIVVIDMKNRTVLLNGGSILPYMTSASTWWSLVPGNNSVALSTNNSTDTVVATVSYRTGYQGI